MASSERGWLPGRTRPPHAVTTFVHPDARPTRGLQFDVACPCCGGGVEFLANSRPHCYEARATVLCRRCSRQHVVVVVLLGENGRAMKPLHPLP